MPRHLFGRRSALGLAALAGGFLAAGCAEHPQGMVSFRAAAAEPFQLAATPPNGGDLGSKLPYGSYLAGLVASNQRDFGSAADFMLQALAADPKNRELLERT